MINRALAPVATQDEKIYMKEALTWEANQHAQTMKSARLAWWVAGVSALIALASVATLAALFPLKTTVPYVYYVDKTTGDTSVVNALSEREVGYRELNEKHWARNYVIARETYLYTLLQLDYDTVLALSSDDVGQAYAKVYEGDNARDKKLGAGTEERVKIISVVLPPDQTGKAVVRFELITKRNNGEGALPARSFVATMAYEFKPSMRGREKDLLMNPLGFKVTSYRIDAEVGTPGATP